MNVPGDAPQFAGVHDSAERRLSHWAACNAYDPRQHLRMSTAEPAAKPWTDSNIFTPADQVANARVLLAYWPSRTPVFLPYVVRSLIRSTERPVGK